MGISPYSNRGASAFWRTGVAAADGAVPPNLYKKRWEIAANCRIATAGSCFAQHIGRELKQRGFQVLDCEPPPESLDDADRRNFGYCVYSARYGNIYTVRQLLQLAREVTGEIAPGDIVWNNDEGRFFDALRPSVEPEGLDSPEEVAIHRAQHLRRVCVMLEQMDLFVFTLGLTEAWANKLTGTVYPTAPGTLCGNYSDDYEFVNFSTREVIQDFSSFKEIVEQIRGGRSTRYLLTVSPVPLTATATNQHVMVASSYSKSVLRAAAGEITAMYREVDYFPSYEIVTNPWSSHGFFESNLRSVSKEGVQRVMATFFSEHGSNRTSADVAPSTLSKDRPDALPVRDDASICEEALLEAFSPNT
jgi:hypothetical protein